MDGCRKETPVFALDVGVWLDEAERGGGSEESISVTVISPYRWNISGGEGGCAPPNGRWLNKRNRAVGVGDESEIPLNAHASSENQ